MLVTRQFDTGRNTWSSSKLGGLYSNLSTPRMSNFEPLPPQPDWREQCSPFPLPGENGLAQSSFENTTSSDSSDNNQSHQHPDRLSPEHDRSLTSLKHDSPTSAIIERPNSTAVDCNQQIPNELRQDSLVSPESTALSLGFIVSNQQASPSEPAQRATPHEDNDMLLVEPKEEDEELDDDDDDMLDSEEPSSSTPQTAAERRAERRKMKRFR